MKSQNKIRPQNDGFGLLCSVVFIALLSLDSEMENPKTSEVRNPELFMFHLQISASLS